MRIIQRRYVTLIEMMIVMFLIALITGVLAYNFRGTLDEGKAFKTRTGIERLTTILNLAIADGATSIDEVETNWENTVKRSPLVQNANVLTKDGWGQKYSVTVEDEEVIIHSARYEAYIRKNPSFFGNEK